MKTVTKRDFTAMLRMLESGFSYLSKDAADRKERVNLYFKVAEMFTQETVAATFERIATDYQQSQFPTPGYVSGQLSQVARERAAKKRWPEPVREPNPHGCLGKLRAQVNIAWKVLSYFEPYEAQHVLCEGRPRPVCPVCGADQEPYNNPFIGRIASLSPGKTANWNPYHKGYLVCPSCEQSASSPLAARGRQALMKAQDFTGDANDQTA